MGSASSPNNPLPTPVIAIVVDSSITLASGWHQILNDYLPHLFGRLTGGILSSLAHLFLGFVTYGPRDSDSSPVLVNHFFAPNALNALMEDRIQLALGRTVAGVSTEMAALEGYASAIEMFDIFENGINQKLLDPITGQPHDAQHPFWNSSPTIDTLAWTTVPTELKKRDINCSILLLCPCPKFEALFSAISDKPVTPWFPVRPHHTVLLSGFAPLPMDEAAVPFTIPTKRPAETPLEQLAPGPKVAKPSSLALQQQLASLPQRLQFPVNNQQQQQNGSDFASRAGQLLNLPWMGHPQGQASFQQSSVQPSPSVPPAIVQSSSTSSTPQVPPAPPAGQQILIPPRKFSEPPFAPHRPLHTQTLRFDMGGEKNPQAPSTTGPEIDIRWQQLHANVDVYKQPAAASTPSFSTSADVVKSSSKRVRDDDTDAPMLGVPSVPSESPKGVKPDWEGPPNEEARKRDERAESVEIDREAMALFERVTKFIHENPESAEAASNALDEILRAYAPDPITLTMSFG